MPIFNNEKEIETVTEFNYLGVTFTKNGKFKLAKQKNIEKATKAMYEVIRRGKRHNLSIECLLDLFDKIVKPILLYGCEVWGFSDNYVIEKIHLKFCKLILHLKQSTPNFMIYGELGRFPLYIDIKTRVISYWCKLLTGKASKLSAISYKLLHSFFCNGNISAPWVKFAKDILDNCGLSNVWTFQNINFNTEWVIAYVKLRLRDHFLQEWNSNLENSPKALNYRLYKQIFEFENYFNILENKDIFTFCKFRTTNTKLPIETGRWNNIARENRKCQLCQENQIGDEFHYIMRCSYFHDKRESCIEKRYLTRINVLKFKEIISSKTQSKLRKLCQLIRNINSSLLPPG